MSDITHVIQRRDPADIADERDEREQRRAESETDRKPAAHARPDIQKRQRARHKQERDSRVRRHPAGVRRRDGAGRLVEHELVDAEIATKHVLTQARQRHQRSCRGHRQARGPARSTDVTAQQPYGPSHQQKTQRSVGLHLHQPRNPALENRNIQDPADEHHTREREDDDRHDHGNRVQHATDVPL